MAKKKPKAKSSTAPGAAQGGVAKLKQAGKHPERQRKQRQQQPKGTQAAAAAAAAGGGKPAAAGALAQVPVKARLTKKQRKAQAWFRKKAQQQQQRTAAKKLAAAQAPALQQPAGRKAPCKPPAASRPAAGQQQQQQQQQQRAPKAVTQVQPAAAAQLSKRKQQGAGAKQAGKQLPQPAAATQAGKRTPPAAAAQLGKRKLVQLEAGTRFFCLDTNVLLAQARLGVRAAWEAIQAGSDSSVQLLVPLVSWGVAWVWAGVPGKAPCAALGLKPGPACSKSSDRCAVPMLSCTAPSIWFTSAQLLGASPSVTLPAACSNTQVPPWASLDLQKVLQEIKSIARNPQQKARYAAQGALALLMTAMPCHARCRVQR